MIKHAMLGLVERFFVIERAGAVVPQRLGDVGQFNHGLGERAGLRLDQQ